MRRKETYLDEKRPVETKRVLLRRKESAQKGYLSKEMNKNVRICHKTDIPQKRFTNNRIDEHVKGDGKKSQKDGKTVKGGVISPKEM